MEPFRQRGVEAEAAQQALTIRKTPDWLADILCREEEI
jgi:hypothetical protein